MKLSDLLSKIKVLGKNPTSVGIISLAAAVILAALGSVWVAIGCLAFVGALDLWLNFSDHRTISQQIHKAFPKQIDVGIAVGLVILVWVFWGEQPFLHVLLGLIFGHLFWSE